MDLKNEIPMILGGHSFIKQLGNDPPANQELQTKIVETCLDNEILWFDTTYQPERIALGNALNQLDRRAEATVIAWNFFVDFGSEDNVGGASYYQPHHIDLMLEQLKTHYIDCLVVHKLGDEEQDDQQQSLAITWQQKGYVKRLGTWAPPQNAQEVFGTDNPYSFMVRPYNVTAKDAAPIFAAYRDMGWENYACSPFVRGWELEKLAGKAVSLYGGKEPEIRAKVADLMLRYSLFGPNVDRLIVAMRRPEWVKRNIHSYNKGEITREELDWLDAVREVGE
ncbi:hypothetical protein ACFL6S_20295 [Candidatus Poribacteria bacterium]